MVAFVTGMVAIIACWVLGYFLLRRQKQAAQKKADAEMKVATEVTEEK